MAIDNNIKNFTAADIEKYHKGQLSPKEMHALEKAALDDPFLADALEGYAVQGVNVNTDIEELKKRLAEQTQHAKVIPIAAPSRSGFPWLRAAVVVILIAGAGLLAYQFLYKNESSNIAQAPEDKSSKANESNAVTSNNDGISDKLSTDSSALALKDSNSRIYRLTIPDKTPEDKLSNSLSIGTEITAVEKPKLDSVFTNKEVAASNATISNAEEKIELKPQAEAKQKTDDAEANAAQAYSKAPSQVSPKFKTTDRNAKDEQDAYKKSREGMVGLDMSGKQAGVIITPTNVFRGIVTDPSNNPLPFAKVTNSRDNVGTYSDAQGNFTLVSTDTSLDVQVKSLGFENRNIQLRRLAPLNKIVMQEDKSLDARVLDTVQHNLAKAKRQTLKFEEPEPEDGWPAYNSYVANNLNMPEKIDMKKSNAEDNTVALSFEVNEYGEPIKIKVEKSLCDQCDKEAIRLVKEGPKWKRKGKKGRQTITIPFQKKE